MGNLTRYFNEEEEAFIKEQPDGFLRILVQDAMDKIVPGSVRKDGMTKDEIKIAREMEECEEDAPTPMVEDTGETMTERELLRDAKKRYGLGTEEVKEAAIEELKKIKGVKVANEALNENLEKGWACLKCGKRLPYFKSKKCKVCGHSMKWS